MALVTGAFPTTTHHQSKHRTICPAFKALEGTARKDFFLFLMELCRLQVRTSAVLQRKTWRADTRQQGVLRREEGTFAVTPCFLP